WRAARGPARGTDQAAQCRAATAARWQQGRAAARGAAQTGPRGGVIADDRGDTGRMNHTRSREVMERARRVLPGGVDSPVRAYRAVGGEPVVIARGAGATDTNYA